MFTPNVTKIEAGRRKITLSVNLDTYHYTNLFNYVDEEAWQRTRNADITVALTPNALTSASSRCSYYPGILEQYYTLITCSSPMMGQWVQMRINVDNTNLNIHEFEVHGI